MTDKGDHVTTNGDLSPGVVRGDYVVTNAIIHQKAASARKRWRHLDEIDYPAITDDENRRTRYAVQLAQHLHRAFKDHGYIEFTSLMSVSQAPLPSQGETAPCYCLITHRSEFSGSLRYAWKFLHNPSLPREERQRLQDSLNQEVNELLSTWSFDLRPPFAPRIVAAHFIYDPASLRISIGPPPHVSTAPETFPDKVRTTSELLAMLSAATGNPLLWLGNIAAITSHYPLFKLALEILDNRSWQPERLRINVDDPEEWDYINPSADAEVGRYGENGKKA